MSDARTPFDRVIRSILDTRSKEIGCDDAYRHLGHLAEQWLAREDAVEEMPMVWRHLQHCRYCQEEFEALVSVMVIAHHRRPFEG